MAFDINLIFPYILYYNNATDESAILQNEIRRHRGDVGTSWTINALMTSCIFSVDNIRVEKRRFAAPKAALRGAFRSARAPGGGGRFGPNRTVAKPARHRPVVQGHAAEMERARGIEPPS